MNNKKCEDLFTELDGEQVYKIKNYDTMDDFFMTIISASDIWNFCWSQGGITAGRINCDKALFPYYTADKVSDAKSYTGPYTLIAVNKGGKRILWEPFATLSAAVFCAENESKTFERNIYKNFNGSKVWFEEINLKLGLTFRYCWTSSELYGLVRKISLINNGDEPIELEILDGARNILPACCTADFQNSRSVLLDAYKKTELESDANLALFTVSSIVTDKAEPNESLYANTCWFSCDEKILLDPKAPQLFALGKQIESAETTKGCRPSCFVLRKLNLQQSQEESWFQVMNTSLDACAVSALKAELKDRKTLEKKLLADIEKGNNILDEYIKQADGIQNTSQKMTCLHHRQNVLFNIMRGGIFQNDGKIQPEDFVKFVSIRNKAETEAAVKLLQNFDKDFVRTSELKAAAEKSGDMQLLRLVYEYLPLTFSRRHGDPSRPWNRFNIKLREADGTPVLDYEGNWRDIFQNWEALVWSFPEYAENLYMKFLNAMTSDGFNPYRITKSGIDWEEPDPDNPWAQIGYWGDHQVIYLEKLLEFASKIDRKSLLEKLNKKLFSTTNVPYRLKPYAKIVENPRETITFERELSDKLKKDSILLGTDAKLLRDKADKPLLVSLASKLLQIVIAKMANFVPGGGIWLNTQRPEWNDANNALAGYGLSIVTLCYVHRFLCFIIDLFESASEDEFALPSEVADCFIELANLFKTTDTAATSSSASERKQFIDKAGKIFEKERKALYAAAFQNGEKQLSKAAITEGLAAIKKHAETTIRCNRRPDGLFHSYNTMSIAENAVEISNLQIMLEGQVAVLSSKLITPEEAVNVTKALAASKLYEKRQNAYLLYPNKELPSFTAKNNIEDSDLKNLQSLIKRSGSIILKDSGGKYHFNGDYRNVSVLRQKISELPESEKPTNEELAEIERIYEKTFNHQNFTGRSGTFFAYEGLGSIYWHMVAKLLLSVQENIGASSDKARQQLVNAYYAIRSGIGFNKEPELYGAFPADPYSHTPENQGAKQPGMTGQVKEEILTRFGELGIDIQDGKAVFCPSFLKDEEFDAQGKLEFYWCGTKIIYEKAVSPKISVFFNNGETLEFSDSCIDKQTSSVLFSRNHTIEKIIVSVCP